MAPRFPHGVGGYVRHLLDGTGLGVTTVKGVVRPKLTISQRSELRKIAKLGQRRYKVKADIDAQKRKLAALDSQIISGMLDLRIAVRGVRLSHGKTVTDTLVVESVSVNVANGKRFMAYLGEHTAAVVTGIKIKPIVLRSERDVQLLRRWLIRHGYDPELAAGSYEFSTPVLGKLINGNTLPEPPDGILIYSEPEYKVQTKLAGED
jgi:hypothetical protein